jgi:hypothetical protein
MHKSRNFKVLRNDFREYKSVYQTSLVYLFKTFDIIAAEFVKNIFIKFHGLFFIGKDVFKYSEVRLQK